MSETEIGAIAKVTTNKAYMIIFIPSLLAIPICVRLGSLDRRILLICSRHTQSRSHHIPQHHHGCACKHHNGQST